MSPTAFDALISAIVGAIVGALIAVFSSHRLELFREKRRDDRHRTTVQRAVASEIHTHLEAIRALSERSETLASAKSKLVDTQWQQHQRDIWLLNPSIGILFRRHYDFVDRIRTGKLILGDDLELPMELARQCLQEADFPLRTGGAEAIVSVSADGECERTS